jgi:hypothetical protein
VIGELCFPTPKMAKKTFSKRTKTLAAAVLFPIPYCLTASLICVLWHTQLPSGARGGAWFELCMPDGLFFNFGLTFLLLIAFVFLIPLIIAMIRDWRSRAVGP